MTPLRSTDPQGPGAGPDTAPGDDPASTVVRRAPFSDNPRVGARGQRTQQRILDAALEVFGEDGYHQCRVDRITERAGCSRAAFYQYFSSKEELFQQLTGQVARRLSASTAALGPVSADAQGWAQLRAWVARNDDVYHRFEPVFRTFDAASESDDTVATGSLRWAERNRAEVRRRIVEPTMAPARLDAAFPSLTETVTHTLKVGSLLRTRQPRAWTGERVGDALTDVLHRSLFGRDDAVNVHPPAARRAEPLRFDPPLVTTPVADGGAEPSAAAARTIERLVDAGRTVFAERGYHQTRVDDVVAAAGVSHGVFYRYFENKEQFARVLTSRAVIAVSEVFAAIPREVAAAPVDGRAALRRWLRRYNEAHTTEAVMARVWAQAALQDTALEATTAAAFDWGRRRMATFLEPRRFGDVDAEAMVLVAFLSVFGARPRSPVEVDAATDVIERGFLGA
jgi:AcrR family transcriptional regulator